MASANAKLPTVFFLLLFLFFIFHTTMAKKQHSFQIPSVTHSSRHGVGGSIKKTAMEYSTRGSHGTGRSKKVNSFAHESGRSRGSRGRRRNFKWQEKVFNAGEHEVPSGPNPISNR
ncbi:hypothetical protein ABKV19_005780 [Rosa sericea]